MHLDEGYSAVSGGDDRLLVTLERLLALDATELRSTLNQATQLIAEAMGADKIDVFLHDATKDSLIALGTSDTPMGSRQKAIGMDVLQVANGGRTVQVYLSGEPYLTGHADDDPEELPGIKSGLGIRSIIGVPLEGLQEGRGVLAAASAKPEFFTERDLRFLEAVARWVSMVAHRAQLTEQAAQEALERGRRAAAEELITIVAHDLRNYLTPLKARIDLIRLRARRRKEQSDLRDAEVAATELARINRMIANLLDVGRLEQGIFELTVQPVDLVSLVRETSEGLSTPRVPIQVNGPDELVIQGDPDRLQQALENVLANAVNHSPERTAVDVSIGQALDEGGRQQAIITVRDQGPGIPPELLPRIFERFVKSQGTSGMGLGLYLASKITSAHRGSLLVDSPPRQGATFRFALPLEGPTGMSGDPSWTP